MMKNDKLIFDIGFHKGEDTQYYLHLGYRVIGVDADPAMVQRANDTFKEQVASGQLTMLNFAVSETDGDQVELNISEWSYWNSLKKDIANRDNKGMTTVAVPTTRLDSLMTKYGVPYYCKIDIEGYDAVAASTLLQSSYRPSFISVETECVGDNEKITEEEALKTLYALQELGYTHFKLVDQSSLSVLSEKPFYNVLWQPSLTDKIKGKLFGKENRPPKAADNLERLNKKHDFVFALYSSGPFGNSLEGKWLDFETAKKNLLMHRADFFRNTKAASYSFWCDWHATKL